MSDSIDSELEDVLHDFAVAESLNEINLSDKLKRGVITADEYDDQLVENYRDNKAKALQAIKALYISKDEILKARPAEHPDTDTPDENLNAQEAGEVMGYNQALKDWSKAMGIGETE